MTPLETLVLVLGIPFFFIEISQLIQLVHSQKRLTSIWEKVLEDPTYAGHVVENAVIGFLDRFAEDEKVQQSFFAFVQNCAITGVVGIREYMGNAPAGNIVDVTKSGKMKMGQGLPGILNQVFGSMLNGVVNGAEKKAAAKATEAVLEGW